MKKLIGMVLVMVMMVGNVNAGTNNVVNELGKVFDAKNIVINKDGSFNMVIDGVTCEDIKVELESNGNLSNESHGMIIECIAE